MESGDSGAGFPLGEMKHPATGWWRGLHSIENVRHTQDATFYTINNKLYLIFKLNYALEKNIIKGKKRSQRGSKTTSW